MSSAHLCPCCTQTLLRHIRANKIYWFCDYCYQEMPVLDSIFPAIPPQLERTEAIACLSLVGCTASCSDNPQYYSSESLI
jgi:hypothetical protein